jgi:hypothetical protein
LRRALFLKYFHIQFRGSLKHELSFIMESPNISHIESLKGTIERLCKAKPYRIGDFKKVPVYNENTHQGIYAITGQRWKGRLHWQDE